MMLLACLSGNCGRCRACGENEILPSHNYIKRIQPLLDKDTLIQSLKEKLKQMERDMKIVQLRLEDQQKEIDEVSTCSTLSTVSEIDTNVSDLLPRKLGQEV